MCPTKEGVMPSQVMAVADGQLFRCHASVGDLLAHPRTISEAGVISLTAMHSSDHDKSVNATFELIEFELLLCLNESSLFSDQIQNSSFYHLRRRYQTGPIPGYKTRTDSG